MLRDIPQFELTQPFQAEASRLFLMLSDEDRWPAGSIARVLIVRAPGYVQLAFLDRSRATLNIESSGAGACEVSVSHELLADQDAVKAQKAFWRDYFEQLRSQVEQ